MVSKLFNNRHAVVGMIHLLPLPGSARAKLDLPQIVAAARKDAQILTDEGVDGLIIENFGDSPFFPKSVPPITVACITAVAADLRRVSHVPIGVNVLRNDGRSALAIAKAVGAQFVRVNVLCGARLTDQGVIQGIAHDLLRDRRQLHAEAIEIWADVDVKHSVSLAPRPLEEEVDDTIRRASADVVIASGSGTGCKTDLDDVRRFQMAAEDTPVFVGSGVDAKNVQAYLETSAGVIVGSALKKLGDATQPVDSAAVRSFMKAARA